tara:strand:+ start:1421 stop:2320 length:900 start_codon:yes stop_codon:yes gene_type:complete
MPKSTVFSDKKDMLSLKNLKKLSSSLIKVGIKKIRITGGEPLVRKDLLKFMNHLYKYKKKNILEEITLTTNGTLLEKYGKDLFNNGVERINVSIDSLIPQKYSFITNGGKINNVMSGIECIKKLGIKIKINVVLIKNFNEDELVSIAEWAGKNNFDLSFIEIMPLGEIEYSRKEQYFPVSIARDKIKDNLGLTKSNYKTNGPSEYYKTNKYNSIVGFISPISNHFCESCNRIRITSNGILYSCLGHEDSVDLKPLLRKNSSFELLERIKESIIKKPEKHYFNIENDKPTVKRFMSFTGG